MSPSEFEQAYPLVIGWIHQTLRAHAPYATSVASRGFPRLPRYFSGELLASAKVIYVESVPTPPLSALGLTQFPEFENMTANGITYLDTFFAHREAADDERLHFHELIHVIQWQTLGPKLFVAAYADGLEKFGYRESPLERMAYDLDARFTNESEPFDAEAIARRASMEMLDSLRN